MLLDGGGVQIDGIGDPSVSIGHQVISGNSITSKYGPYNTEVIGNATVSASSSGASMGLKYSASISNGKIKVQPKLEYMCESSSTTFYLGVYNNNIYYRFIGY